MGCSSCLRFSNVSGVTAACFVVIFVLYSVQRLKPDIRVLELTSHWKRKNTILTHSDGSENHMKYEENLARDSVQMAKFNARKQEQRFEVQQHSNLTEEKDTKSNEVKGNVTIKRGNKIKKAQKATQTQRLQHFRKTCKKYKFNADSINSNDSLRVLYSEKYKLAYRLVPKVGSTFMIQVYTILKHDANASDVFDLARSDVHDEKVKSYRKDILSSSLNTYTVLVMARNPYSRLYSAYIDKVFILNTLGLCKDIRSTLFGKGDEKHLCKFNISFEQFLEYYFEKGGTRMESHYGPLLSKNLSKTLCNLNNIMIIKQETFAKDLEHALKSVHVNDHEYNIIYDEMHSKHTKTTISSIIKTVYKKFASSIQSRSCLTWKEIAKKLWVSFQIQGYIRKTARFPKEEYIKQEDYANPEYLIQVVMKEVTTNPLKHDEKVRQRNKALVKAYSNVDKKHILKIQERFAMDFDMFQYPIDIQDSFT